MEFLPYEEVIGTPIPGLTLTNLRIRYETKDTVHSMFLRELASMHLLHKEKRNYMYLAIGFIGLAVYTYLNLYTNPITAYVPAVSAGLAAYFFLLYLDSKKTQFVVLSNGGGVMPISISGSNKAGAIRMIGEIERVKAGA